MKPEQKTLVILTPGFPASEADSTCLPMQQNFVKAIKENHPGLNIIILSFQYPYFVKSYSWFGIQVMSFNGQNKPGLARQLLRMKLNSTLKKIHQAHSIAGIISFWYGECAWVGKRFADKNKLKHVCWILGQDARKNNKYVKQAGLKATELVALSDFIQDEFERNYLVRPAFVIPPGIQIDKSQTATKQKDIELLAAGSLIPLKQFEIFVETVAEIKKTLPDVKAVLIGDGPEKNKLQALIAKHDLQSNISLTGELAHSDVLQWMQSAKVFLHPSAYEGFGVVCIEALYVGCRVISFCKPMKQKIEHWDIVNNKDEMKEKALGLLQDAGTDFTAALPFRMDDTVKKMLELFSI